MLLENPRNYCFVMTLTIWDTERIRTYYADSDNTLFYFLSIFLIQRLVDKENRVHCSLNLNTETGRLSSRKPNLQNQPALEKDQYKISKYVWCGVTLGGAELAEIRIKGRHVRLLIGVMLCYVI